MKGYSTLPRCNLISYSEHSKILNYFKWEENKQTIYKISSFWSLFDTNKQVRKVFHTWITGGKIVSILYCKTLILASIFFHLSILPFFCLFFLFNLNSHGMSFLQQEISYLTDNNKGLTSGKALIHVLFVALREA